MSVSTFEGVTSPLQSVTLGRVPRARDPNLSGPAGATPQPPPAPVTTDNNRVTFRVPAEATKLTLGQGDATETATRNKRPGIGTESGIVGHTDAHIHWETFGTKAMEAKTLVRLGTPPTSVPPGGYDAGAFTGIGCMFPEAYSKWNGYSMVTQGAAYQEARENHLISSATGEVRVVGKTLVSLASTGNVVIGADSGTTPKDLIQNQGGPDATGDYGEPDKHFRIQQLARLGTKGVALVTGGAALIAGVISRINFEPIEGATGFEPPMKSLLGIAEYGLDAVELVGKAVAWAAELVLPSSSAGNVSAYAEKTVTIGAEETVVINAGVAGSIVAGGAASIAAPVASVIGLIGSSMTAIFANIGALWSATLQGTFGHAVVRSPRGVQVYSSMGGVTVTGLSDVQLNSNTGGAYVHGMTSAYIGSGPVMGWGLRASPLSVTVGQMATPALFKFSSFVPMFGMSISDVSVNIQHTESMVTVNPVGVNIFGMTEVSTTAPIVNTTGEIDINLEAPVINVTGGIVNLG